ncbi:MAG: amino acid permease [Gemmatimonadetes bacterium]|nr:amino acid permease [Gemmatimonadota bacterium]
MSMDEKKAGNPSIPASGSPGSAATDPARPRLVRRLGTFSAAAVLVGSTIGSGIFRVPSTVVNQGGTLGASGILWILGAVFAICGALTIAELAAMHPDSGGIYVYVRQAFGPIPAFLFGWTQLLVIRPAALGALAILFAEYTGHFVALSDTGERVLAGALIALLGAANYRSLGWAAAIQNVTTAGKVLALVSLTAIALFLADPAKGAMGGPLVWGPTSWGGFGLALVGVMWAYDGWADLTFVAGEVKDPGKALPRALLLGTALVVVVYLAVIAGYYFSLSLSEIGASELVAADAAERVMGRVGGSAVAAMVMLSAFGALNGSTITGPRIFWAMADDGLFFRKVAAVHPRFNTPHVAIALCAGLGIFYVSFQTFEQLADAFVLGIWPFYALAVWAVFILRKKEPDVPRTYRTWGYPVTPLLFLAASLYMLGNALFMQPVATGIGAALILSGIPVWWIRARLRARSAGGAGGRR